MTLREEYEENEKHIALLKQRQQDLLRASLEAAEEDKIMRDEFCSMLLEPHLFRKMEYPISVSAIHWQDNNTPVSDWSKRGGSWVSIRPVAKEYEEKTFLGIYLGDIALGMSASYEKETGFLHLKHSFHNPAIYVPDLKRVIFGNASWWGKIETPEQLRKISDADIENVWYVRALKDLQEGEKNDGLSK